MSTNVVDPLRLRRVFGRLEWAPPEPYGPQGWRMTHRNGTSSVIVSYSDHPDWDGEWVHASIAHADTMPTYAELQQLHRGAFGGGYAYQCFVPKAQHVNHHPYALHLWGRLDGKPCLPEFGKVLPNGQRMI